MKPLPIATHRSHFRGRNEKARWPRDEELARGARKSIKFHPLERER